MSRQLYPSEVFRTWNSNYILSLIVRWIREVEFHEGKWVTIPPPLLSRMIYTNITPTLLCMFHELVMNHHSRAIWTQICKISLSHIETEKKGVHIVDGIRNNYSLKLGLHLILSPFSSSDPFPSSNFSRKKQN